MIFFPRNDENLLVSSKSISLFGLIVAILACLMLTYGVFFGRFQYQVKYCNLEFENLPVSFNKLKIVQISDLHISTYHSHEKQFERIIELVNAQNPDIIFFTGDLINNFAEEVNPYVPKLQKLRAKYGKYAILGNHDYGDYYIWHNEKEKQENHQLLKAYIKSAGFKLLLNENIALIKYEDTIIIAGTENYGPKPYRQVGDLEKTLKGTTSNNFILLLSHDPFMWEHFVISYPNIKVTFSGHTHGMQIGISCGAMNWTPFHYGYKRWIGLYKENNQFLYVNKGLGAGLYTGRIGMWPEITVFELRRKK
jgi:predicted MPP superfamily phosphohydrolase